MANAPTKPNLLKFSTRAMCENDRMRNRIYDYLRKRFGTPKASLPELRVWAECGSTPKDEFAIKLLDYAKHLEQARKHIIKASLEIRR